MKSVALDLVGMCGNVTEITSCVHYLRHFVQNRGILFQKDHSCNLQLSIVAYQGGKRKSKDIHIDHMTIEIVCTDLCGILIKSEYQMFYISQPPGGVIKVRCEKC